MDIFIMMEFTEACRKYITTVKARLHACAHEKYSKEGS